MNFKDVMLNDYMSQKSYAVCFHLLVIFKKTETIEMEIKSGVIRSMRGGDAVTMK